MRKRRKIWQNIENSIDSSIYLRVSTAVIALCVGIIFVLGYVNIRLLQRVDSNSSDASRVSNKIYSMQKIIDENYVGEYDSDEMMDLAAEGLLAGMGDVWSTYMNSERYAEYLVDSSGKLVGIGVSVVYSQDIGGILITDVYDDSPAQEVGFQIGDIITGALDKTVENDGFDEVIDAIKGEEGTFTTIYYTSDGEEKSIEVERATVVKKSVYSKVFDDNIGYIQITEFDSGVDDQFEIALQEMLDNGIEKIIFDVRNNPGGSVVVLTNMLDLLLPEGDIITLVDKNGKEIKYTSDENEVDIEMAVLVNASSISAAELFAAALQEYEKAVVVGDKTIGKGYAQRAYELEDGSALILSDQKYYTPKGENLAGIGIEPDVPVALSEEDYLNFYTLDDEDDDQLQAAIEELR